jgi:hypothetical protein
MAALQVAFAPRPPDRQANVEPPGRDARATNGSERTGQQPRQAALPEGGGATSNTPRLRWGIPVGAVLTASGAFRLHRMERAPGVIAALERRRLEAEGA